ncbi:MFS transporter [Dictyobacter alpinus]|uniref:MFS transporter n=2 Tax=Dictyobacter alpinus TaxID=2014873 RepID=A0A402BFN4_9CHLR|nr:MFS transporter [Dictyobacter alpinus]
MSMVPHIALLLLAPFIGELEDLYGKRPFLFLGFVGLMIADIGYLFAHSVTVYICIRLFQAIVSVGIMPAMLGIFADAVPRQHRTHRISLLMAGQAGGLTFGPIIGGFLLVHWGSMVAFSLSALLNLVVLCLIGTRLPKTSNLQKVRRHRKLTLRCSKSALMSLLLPLSFLIGLLVLDFILAFGHAFVEPQKALYLYKVLNFTPVQFGLLMSTHGLAMLLGLLILSLWGDSANKRVTIVIGLLSNAFLIFSLLFVRQFTSLFFLSLFSGIGGGMVRPLLSAYYLNRTTPQHRSSLIGIKEAVGALGSIVGSLTVVLAGSWLLPHRTFLLGGSIVVGVSLLALFVLRSSHVALPSSAMASSGLHSAEPLPELSEVTLHE